MGDNNGASVHIAVYEYLAVDREGNCNSITHGTLKHVCRCMLPES